MILRRQFLPGLLLIVLLACGVRAEGDDEDLAHFSDPKGRISWVVDDSALPWLGSFYFLSSTNASRTVLLTVADSSSGAILGECAVDRSDGEWRRFFWTLSHNSLQCNVSDSLSTKIRLSSDKSRSFSMRILASKGPRCMRDVIIQNEQPEGCPPTLHRNSFSSRYFQCGCPDVELLEEEHTVANGSARNSVPFPLFKLSPGGANESQEASTTQAPAIPERPRTEATSPSWNAHPCAEHVCANNGTCVVGADSKANCLCFDGFVGDHCESHVCTDFCSNGGTCSVQRSHPVCACHAPFSGDRCEMIECEPQCRNGGMCAYDETSSKAACECTEGFIGMDCGVVDPCHQPVCSTYGESAQCVVNPFYTTNPSATPFSCVCQNDLDGSMGEIDCEELETMRQHLALLQSTSAPIPESRFEIHENPTTEMEQFSGMPMHHLGTVGTPSPEPVTDEEDSEEDGHPLFPLTTVPPPTETSNESSPVFSTLDLSEILSATSTTPQPSAEEEPESTTVTEVSESEGDNGFAVVTQIGGDEEHPKTTEMIPAEEEEETTTTTEVTTTTTSTTTSTSTTTTTTTTTTTQAPTTTTELVTEPPSTTVEEIPEEETSEESTPFPVEETTANNSVEGNRSSAKPVDVVEHEKDQESDADSNRSTGKKNGQGASTTSWIVAFIAIIAILAVIIAVALFIVRYVRRSRKLHGKYNPAREENALASSYSMPMTSITKEERLI